MQDEATLFLHPQVATGIILNETLRASMHLAICQELQTRRLPIFKSAIDALTDLAISTMNLEISRLTEPARLEDAKQVGEGIAYEVVRRYQDLLESRIGDEVLYE